MKAAVIILVASVTFVIGILYVITTNQIAKEELCQAKGGVLLMTPSKDTVCVKLQRL